MTEDTAKIMNGFCVSGCLLAVLTFFGGFYVHIVRHVHISHPIHMWFGLLSLRSPFFIIMALGLSIAGVRTCRKHSQLKGRSLGLVGMVLSGIALAHWIVTALWWYFVARIG